jgi:hypothetical protein
MGRHGFTFLFTTWKLIGRFLWLIGVLLKALESWSQMTLLDLFPSHFVLEFLVVKALLVSIGSFFVRLFQLLVSFPLLILCLLQPWKTFSLQLFHYVNRFKPFIQCSLLLSDFLIIYLWGLLLHQLFSDVVFPYDIFIAIFNLYTSDLFLLKIIMFELVLQLSKEMFLHVSLFPILI